MVVAKESRTSPTTLPTIRGSVDVLAIVRGTRGRSEKGWVELKNTNTTQC